MPTILSLKEDSVLIPIGLRTKQGIFRVIMPVRLFLSVTSRLHNASVRLYLDQGFKEGFMEGKHKLRKKIKSEQLDPKTFPFPFSVSSPKSLIKAQPKGKREIAN